MRKGVSTHHSDGICLYVGADAATVARRRVAVTGHRMFSAAYGPKSRFLPHEVPHVRGMLDSGAFSDPPDRRLHPLAALERQLAWERNASRLWGASFVSEALVSYDRLIDETWIDGKRHKRRWSLADAEEAVTETVEAAFALAFHRQRLKPRQLVLSCQGVEWEQYRDCAEAVLAFARPEDILGLGGWCIIGRFTTWMPQFRRTVEEVVPRVAAAGLSRVHVFGVLYLPALTHLANVARECRVQISTDSSGPVLAVTWKNQKKAGARAPDVEGNVAWWRERLRGL
jgi:hypothetical protein